MYLPLNDKPVNRPVIVDMLSGARSNMSLPLNDKPVNRPVIVYMLSGGSFEHVAKRRVHVRSCYRSEQCSKPWLSLHDFAAPLHWST